MKVLVKVVGIASSFVSETCAAGATTASMPFSPLITMVSNFAPCCVLLDLLEGIQESEMRGIDSGLDRERNWIGLIMYIFFCFFDNNKEEKKDGGKRTTRV